MQIHRRKITAVIVIGLIVGMAHVRNGHAQELEAELPTFVQVRVRLANLRAGPSTRTAVLARLPRGTILEVLGRQGRWYRVRLVDPERGTLEGYIADWIVEPMEETPLPRAEPPPSPPRPEPSSSPPTGQPTETPASTVREAPAPPPAHPAEPTSSLPARRPLGAWVSAGLVTTSLDNAQNGFGFSVGIVYTVVSRFRLFVSGFFAPIDVGEPGPLGAGRFQVRSAGGGILFEPVALDRFAPVLIAGVLFHFSGFQPEADFSAVGLKYETSVSGGVGFFAGGGLRARLSDRVDLLLLARKAFYSVNMDVTQTDVVTNTTLSATLQGVGVHPLSVELGLLVYF